MNYHHLGDYIRPIDVRNRELAVTKPMGINIDKFFMPSVANVIGTDLSAYKLVFKNQFACNLMHVGRDERIPMAMLTEDNPIIVSPAYFVFEVTKVEELLPEYLIIWFRRPEFDRNAWFYTDADVRGGMDKEALLDMCLPVPTIARQREIVAEYETLSNRICLNEQMIEKLEATAQALYRKMFVDGIDPDNLIEGWRKVLFYDVFSCAYGKGLSTEFIEQEGDYPVYGANGVIGYYDKKTISDYAVLITSRGSGSGDILRTFYPEAFVTNNAFVVEALPDYYYCELPFVYNLLLDSNVKQFVSGSAQPQLTNNDLNSFIIVMPPKEMVENYCSKTRNLFKYTYLLFEEIAVLSKTQELFLSKLS